MIGKRLLNMFGCEERLEITVFFMKITEKTFVLYIYYMYICIDDLLIETLIKKAKL